MFELKPGLADGGGIGPVANDRGVLTVERALSGQLIDALQQGLPGEGQFTSSELSAGLIDRLGNSRLVLVELLEGPLEVGEHRRGWPLGVRRGQTPRCHGLLVILHLQVVARHQQIFIHTDLGRKF